jgi:hypothetical protein
MKREPEYPNFQVNFQLQVKVGDGYRETYKRTLPDAYGDGLARFVAVKAILAEGGSGQLRDDALAHLLGRTAIMARRVGGAEAEAFAAQLEGLAGAVALSAAFPPIAPPPRCRDGLGGGGNGGERGGERP